MKKILTTLLLIPFLGIAQTIENLYYISPFHNEVAAIKKGNEWGFIDQEGKLIIDFRNDLVLTKTDNTTYPIFSNDKCLIAHQKDDILYYGYIDKTGKTVITPQFLNATNFEYNKALVLKVHKETIGYNDIFKKDVVSYHYFEVVINKEGQTLDHLTKLAVHISPKHKKNNNTLKITSKLISKDLALVQNRNTWTLKQINNKIKN